MLVSFSAKHSHAAMVAETSTMEAAGGVVAAHAAAAAPPPAPAAPAPAAPPAATVDTSSVPGVALMQSVQGFVNGLALAGFDAALSTQRRAAVLNSLLFAQLAANGDVQSDPTKTFASQCVSYLPVCGFTIVSQASASYNAGGLTVGLDKALLDCLSQVTTDISSLNIMKDVINALETLPDNNGALTLFSHNTISNGHATVATTTVTEPNGAAGDLELTLTIFDFDFTSSETRVLWITVDDSHSKLNYSTVTLSLQDDAYASVAASINSQLAQFRTGAISNVKLKSLGGS